MSFGSRYRILRAYDPSLTPTYYISCGCTDLPRRFPCVHAHTHACNSMQIHTHVHSSSHTYTHPSHPYPSHAPPVASPIAFSAHFVPIPNMILNPVPILTQPHKRVTPALNSSILLCKSHRFLDLSLITRKQSG